MWFQVKTENMIILKHKEHTFDGVNISIISIWHHTSQDTITLACKQVKQVHWWT